VLVCIGVVDVDALETGVVDQAAPRGVREDAEQVVVVLDTQRLLRLSECDREVNAVRGTRRHNLAAAGRRSAAVAMATPARRAALRRHLRAPRDPDQGGPSAPNFGACEARARASSVADLGAP